MMKLTTTDAAHALVLERLTRCKCRRWIHEDCVDEDDVDSDATKLCLLCYM